MTNRLSEDQHGSFDPGPSFTDGPIPAPDADMLPSWLQRFGETTAAEARPADASTNVDADVDADVQPEPDAKSADMQGGTTDDMQIPAWLQDAAPADADTADDAASTETAAFSGSDFLTDDDLPDWLRSISTPPDVALPASDEPQPVHAAPQQATATLPVPQVRRIWVTQQETQDVSAGASMFAAVAEASGSRPDILVSEAPVASQPVAATATTSAQPVAASSTADAATTSSEASKSGRMRLYLIAAIAIVVILALVLLLGR